MKIVVKDVVKKKNKNYELKTEKMPSDFDGCKNECKWMNEWMKWAKEGVSTVMNGIKNKSNEVNGKKLKW